MTPSLMEFFSAGPSPVQRLHHPLLARSKVDLFIKRDDLLHPLVSGNKWRKLKHNLLQARQQGCQRLLSFGGAYSNHIHALAHAGRLLGFDTIGVIRGGPFAEPSPTLRQAAACGMHLHHVSRQDYRRRDDARFLRCLAQRFGDFQLLPEGGSNTLALRGCAELVRELDQQLDHYHAVCLPCGTGGTLAGVAAALAPDRRALGFAVLKGAGFLQRQVAALQRSAGLQGDYELLLDYHFGGYARADDRLREFIARWRPLPLDPVYTAKMMYGVIDLIDKGAFAPGSRIVVVHTGGLQGAGEEAGDIAAEVHIEF